MFIYTIGTGNATLDALAADSDASNFQEFFPFLPLRLNNVAVDEGVYATNGLFEETRKAYRKANHFKNIEPGDIDYAYIMYGVSLNVQENACRKYIFNFLENMIPFQNSGSGTMADFPASIAAHAQAKADLEAWEATDWDNLPFWEDRPPRPEIPSLSIPEVTNIRLRTGSPLMPSFDIRMQWSHIDIEQITGVYDYDDGLLGTRPAKKNEVQFQKNGTISWEEETGIWNLFFDTRTTVTKTVEVTEMYWQIDDNTYRKLTVYGLIHSNYIYGGKAVTTTAHEALDETGEPSGFVVPLHYPTMKAMSIVDYT